MQRRLGALIGLWCTVLQQMQAWQARRASARSGAERAEKNVATEEGRGQLVGWVLPL